MKKDEQNEEEKNHGKRTSNEDNRKPGREGNKTSTRKGDRMNINQT
jgi:hypothetical protein